MLARTLALLLVLLASPAWATPTPITSGEVFYTVVNQGDFYWHPAGVFPYQPQADANNTFSCPCLFSNPIPGQPYSLGGHAEFFRFDPELDQLNGHGGPFVVPFVLYAMMDIVAVVPGDEVHSSFGVVAPVTAPFTMTGELFPSHELIAGSGIATAGFGSFFLRYTFTDPVPIPAPEPATWLLVVSGLVVFGAWALHLRIFY